MLTYFAGIYQQSQYPSSYSLATLLEEDDEDIVTDIEVYALYVYRHICCAYK
jgi:hypothetical protein